MGAMSSYRRQSEKTAFDRGLQRFAATRLGGLLFITVLPAIDKRLMPLTRGRIRMSLTTPSLLLHARGAKSGQPRVTPLVCTPHGDAYVVVASKAGADRHPAWYHNVVADPDVEIDVDGRRRRVRAREAQGAERDELWALVNDNYDGYTAYQERAGQRTIPVIVLEPR